MFSIGKVVFDTAYRVRVSGLPFGFSQSTVTSFLEPFGPIDCIRVTTEMGKPTGQALVSFQTVEQAMEASQTMNGSFFPPSSTHEGPRRVCVRCDFRGPRIVGDVSLPREPNPRRLIKLVRDKAVGAKWPTDPVMASTNESRMLRRYKTGGLPRAHDRQR